MNKTGELKFFYGYIIVLAALFIMMIAWGAAYTFGIFFKPVSADFSWTRAMTSGAFSTHIFLQGFLAIVMGRLTDRFGPRMIMVACGFCLGLGYLLMSQVSAVWQLYLFYGGIIGIGMSGTFVPLVSIIPRWFVKRRGVMTGMVISGIGLGAMIMPPLARWLIFSYGWHTSYIIVGTMALVLIILAAQFLRRDPAQVGQLPYGENEVKGVSSVSPARGFSLQEVIRTGQFWMFCAMYGCYGFYLMIIVVHIPLHITDLGISATIAANILAVIGGLTIVGRITMGSVADRIGNKSVLFISFSLVSVALFWLLVANEVWMLYLFAVIFGFTYAGLDIVASPMLAELFGLGLIGVIYGIISLWFSIGGTVGPVLAGHIFDISGSYNLAFLLCAIVSVIGLILASLLKPTTRGGLL